MDNVKRIYIKCFKDSDKLAELYFDDIKVHTIQRDEVECIINGIINSEEKILDIYNSEIYEVKLSEENRKIIFMNGFAPFKEFIKSGNVNVKSFIDDFKIIGIRPYIELLKDKTKIGGNSTIDYIVRFIIIFMYSKHIKEI